MVTETVVLPPIHEPIPEKVTDRKVIVYKTLIDPTVIKLATEKVKDRLFVKFGFLKPNPDQIQQIAFEKDYEAFVIVDGKYHIDYYRRRLYILRVDDKAQEVILFNQRYKPEASTEPVQGKVVRIEGEERLIHEAKAYIVLSADGREVSPKRIPSAPSDEHSRKLAAEMEATKRLEMLPNEEIDILRNKIVRRPPEIKRVVKELFEVVDRAVIYTPIYKVKFQNVKTGEVKTVKFDGVTARLLS